MNKVARPYLDDILDSIIQIEKYMSEVIGAEAAFIKDIEKQDAVLRRLTVIGEAAKRLETSFRTQFDQIPWRKMTGLRDVLMHEYDKVDLHQIWLVIERDLPLLKEQITQILDDLEA